VITLLPGGGTIDTNGNTTVIRQPIIGAGALTVEDSSLTPDPLILTGTNTYQGGTTIASGTLLFRCEHPKTKLCTADGGHSEWVDRFRFECYAGDASHRGKRSCGREV
jgi:autotransporter-associated beta strand protein